MTEAALREAAALAITVNGDARSVAPGTTLAELLGALALDPRLVVVEHNRTILRDREAYPYLALGDGDTLEIVHFVGGG
ncbi:MAG: hypothetical protein NVS9B3_08600 [Gemmatimonadaceae bacterium]